MTKRDAGRIFILEDDELRCSWFHQEFSQYEHDLTGDVSEAVRWLTEQQYALIFLDHDLAEEHYYSETPDDAMTGYAIAAWLAQHPDQQTEAQIIIHSLNYVGAQRMLDVLLDAGRDAQHVPFPYLPWLF